MFIRYALSYSSSREPIARRRKELIFLFFVLYCYLPDEQFSYQYWFGSIINLNIKIQCFSISNYICIFLGYPATKPWSTKAIQNKVKLSAHL
uniref:Ovule protein n=1 Tax=Heterorhabditis bacteriophora TaxID=37862 RepID=A0A1I7X1P0_HETBA